MPRDGTGVAQVYPGSNTNASNTVIQSGLENNLVNDLYALINSTPTNLLAGSASNPSITFTGDANTGWYNVAADEIGMTLGGVLSWDYAKSKTIYQWVDPGAAVGPVIELFRDSASPATSDLLGGILFTGRNASAAKKTYAQVAGDISSAAAGSETGQVTIRLVNTGTLADYYVFDPSGILPLSNLMGNGSAGFPWGSLDLVTGGVIRFGATNVTLAHSSGALFLSGATTAVFDISDSTAGQIKFPASQHASANANTLDDYAETTGSVQLQFGAANVGLTTSTSSYIARKIGALTHVSIRIVMTAVGSSTGTATVINLPYSGSGSGLMGVVSGTGFSGLTGSVIAILSGTTLTLQQWGATGTSAITNSSFTSSSAFSISLCYPTA